MRQPITVLDDHSRAVRARFLAALEQGKTTEEATRIANFVVPSRDPVELPPLPADLTAQDARAGGEDLDAADDAADQVETSSDEAPAAEQSHDTADEATTAEAADEATTEEANGGEDQASADAQETPAAESRAASLANLDRDGDGNPGGSLPADQQGDEIKALRAEAEAKGVSYDGRWGAARLRKEIEAAS